MAREQLLAAKQKSEESLNVSFSGDTVSLFDAFYSKDEIPCGAITQVTKPIISGTVAALIGDILITRYEDRTLALPLKQFTGYPIALSETITPLDLGPQQMQPF